MSRIDEIKEKYNNAALKVYDDFTYLLAKVERYEERLESAEEALRQNLEYVGPISRKARAHFEKYKEKII